MKTSIQISENDPKSGQEKFLIFIQGGTLLGAIEKGPGTEYRLYDIQGKRLAITESMEYLQQVVLPKHKEAMLKTLEPSVAKASIKDKIRNMLSHGRDEGRLL